MQITMDDLTISPAGIDQETLLTDWEWAMPEPIQPVLLTAMGDLFAQGESGAVFFLDASEGKVVKVTDDGSEFESLLADQDFVVRHFFPMRIIELREAGVSLEPKQVFSYKQPLVLGGEDEIENIEATDVSVHLSLLGQIHEQVKDLPDGTVIDGVDIE